jgi:uncharacterized membrane protein
MDYILPSPVPIRLALAVAGIGLGAAALAAAAVVFRRKLAFLKPTPAAVVWSLTAAFFLFFASASLGRHYGMATCALDLGYYANAVYHFGRGHFFQQSIIPGDRFLNHCSPLLALLGPLTYLFKNPAYLLPIQSLLLASGIPLVYAAARPAAGSRWPAAALAAAFALSPGLHGAALFDFHPRALAVPLVLGAFYFFGRAKVAAALACAVLAALAHEELALHAVVLVAVGGIAAGRRRAGLVAAAALAAYAVFAVAVYPALTYAPGLGPASNTFLTRHLAFARALGGGAAPPSLLAEKAGYLVASVAPVAAFLPAAGVYLLAVLTPLALPAATAVPPAFKIGCQYPLALVPFLFGAAAMGARRLVRSAPNGGRSFAVGAGSLAAVAVQLLLIGTLARPYYGPTLAAAFPCRHDKALAGAANRVPAGVPVYADDPFGAHLAHRRYCYFYGAAADAELPAPPEVMVLNRRVHALADLPAIMEKAEAWGLGLAECNADYAYFVRGPARRTGDELFGYWFGTIEEWECWAAGGRDIADPGAHDGRAKLVGRGLYIPRRGDYVYPPGEYGLIFFVRAAGEDSLCNAAIVVSVAAAEGPRRLKIYRRLKNVLLPGEYKRCPLRFASDVPFTLAASVDATAPFYFDRVLIATQDFTRENAARYSALRGP